MENVIPLSKLIGLLFLFRLPLPSISFLKTKRNDLARPVMGTIFLVERSERSEHTVVLSSRFLYILLASERSEGDTLRPVQSRIADIGECGSTLYVGLSGIVRNLIQKSTGWDHTFLSIFFFFFFFFSYG